MDWHATVYGSRAVGSGGHGFYDPGDDEEGRTFGDPDTISDAALRRLGGKAYFRAHQLLDDRRFTDLRLRHLGALTVLKGRVPATYQPDGDCMVQARLDEQAHRVIDSSCTCRAFGRQGPACKHVVALIMAYNESSQAFAGADDWAGDQGRSSSARSTSGPLAAYMHRQEGRRRQAFRDRQLNLLKQESGPVGGRHLPIGSVGLIPDLTSERGGWLVRLHITLSSHGVAYLVKDLPALLRAVDQGAFMSYGRRLAFIHSRDTFDDRAQALLTILERAGAIRRSLAEQEGGMRRRLARARLAEIRLSDDEVAQILDLFVDSGLTLDYTPPEDSFLQTMPAPVLDGDPDPGIAVSKEADGYRITHALAVERFIVGQASSFVIVRPSQPGLGLDPGPVIHRCSARFMRHRDLLETLCRPGEDRDLHLDADDLDLFARTVLPDLDQGAQEGSGLSASLPEELDARRRPPCRIELYLDRDRQGVSCDLKARYGDRLLSVGADPASEDESGRDRESESLARQTVRRYFPLMEEGLARIPEENEEAIHTLLTRGLPVLKGLGRVFSTTAFDGLSVVSHPQIRVGVRVRSGLVEISPIADEVQPEEAAAILADHRRRRRFHRLRNGAFVELADLNTDAVDTLAQDLGIDPADLAKGPVHVPDFQLGYLDALVPEQDRDPSFRDYLKERKPDPQGFRVHDGLRGQLRPYQVEGLRWLCTLSDRGFGGILADEMGLGKTIQMLAYLLSRRDQARDRGPSLIVCPASLVYNWEAECRRFTPDLRVGVLAGGRGQRQALLDQARSYDLLITSYDLLRRDLDRYRSLPWYALVLDEAQYIKNHATKAARAVRALDSLHRFALTGTPIENRLSELWSIFDFLMPGMLGPYSRFRDRFEMPILSGDQDAQSRLQALVGPFILRRLKSQVLTDLPEKIENVISVPLQGRQRKLYAALEQELRATLNKERDQEYEVGKIQVLAQLTRLREVCCDPRLVYQDQGRDRRGDSAKLDAIEDLVVSCQDAGRKMLIFSQFTSYLDLIAQRLRRLDVSYDLITGATSKKRRLELVEQFNRDATPVFLISLKAGNTGLNLTGACVVVHADPWWNAAAQEQANDRAHRIGQTQDVNVYQVVAKDTIEERILNLQHSKSDLASRFVDSAASTGAAGVARLSRKDLLALLS